MSEPRAFCPQCKQEVVFIKAGGVSTCPACGFQYELTPPALSGEGYEPAGTSMGFFGLLLRTLFIIVAVVVVGLAVAFAGCVLALRH